MAAPVQHFHGGIVAVIFAGASAILVINVVKLAAAAMVKQNIPGGRSLGGLVWSSNA